MVLVRMEYMHMQAMETSSDSDADDAQRLAMVSPKIESTEDPRMFSLVVYIK